MIGIVYGYHENSDKSRFWGEFLNMKLSLNVPVMLLGDFNETRKYT